MVIDNVRLSSKTDLHAERAAVTTAGVTTTTAAAEAASRWRRRVSVVKTLLLQLIGTKRAVIS